MPSTVKHHRNQSPQHKHNTHNSKLTQNCRNTTTSPRAVGDISKQIYKVSWQITTQYGANNNRKSPKRAVSNQTQIKLLTREADIHSNLMQNQNQNRHNQNPMHAQLPNPPAAHKQAMRHTSKQQPFISNHKCIILTLTNYNHPSPHKPTRNKDLIRMSTITNNPTIEHYTQPLISMLHAQSTSNLQI
eukprot:gene3421-2372_t